jgi:hypothetical protein
MRRIPYAGHRALTPDVPGSPLPFAAMRAPSTPITEILMWRHHPDGDALRCCPIHL